MGDESYLEKIKRHKLSVEWDVLGRCWIVRRRPYDVRCAHEDLAQAIDNAVIAVEAVEFRMKSL